MRTSPAATELAEVEREGAPAEPVVLVPSLPVADRLAVLAVEIRQAHDDVQDTFRAAAERAIDAGRALIEAKLLCGHGQWLAWLTSNTRLSVRQSQRYMQLAKRAEGGKCVPGDAFNLREVVAALAPERQKSPTARAAREPAEPRHKALSADMQSAVEALASDPETHGKFVVAACEHLTDIETIRAVLCVLLDFAYPADAADALLQVFSRKPGFAGEVAKELHKLAKPKRRRRSAPIVPSEAIAGMTEPTEPEQRDA
jgi:hypothetical protein